MAEPIQTADRATIDAIPATPLQPRRASFNGERIAGYLLPLLVFGVFLVLWQFLPRLMGFHTYEIPNFTDTLAGLKADWSVIGTALLVTLQDAILGFIIGNGLALLGATIFSYSRLMERAFYPLAIVVQTIPILVYAPIFVILFFRFQPLSSNAQSASVVGVAV
ncbi:MAG: ABC transporter permease, partial [Chloroflexota bacterium]